MLRPYIYISTFARDLLKGTQSNADESDEGLQSLFRTHPSTEERIQRLLTIAQQQNSPVMAFMSGI
jgi:Zn-dependent protease with chaperone function